MDVEIITIGDEIVNGLKTDTNSPYIAQRFTSAGFSVKYVSSVGDSLAEMEEVFRLALKRARLVITTGGLGPTDDDLTKRAIVKVFKRNLIFHDEILEQIKARFTSRGMEMPPASQNQALLPQGATFFPNQHGSAVGICISEQGRIFISLPGVPLEMKQILADEILPYLAGLNLKQATSSAILRTTGIGESSLAELLKPGLRLQPGVKLAYLPSHGSVSLRVMASDESQAEADNKTRDLVRHLEKTVGKYIFGRDEDTLEGVVGQLLQDNDKTLSVAESCTGGQLGMAVTSAPGSSAYFVGGCLAYANEVKTAQLLVPDDILENQGAVSEECAAAMARGCRKLFDTDYALSITGIAGPEGGSEDKPVGTTYIGLSSAHSTFARLYKFGKDRAVNRTRAVYAALELLRRNILDID